MFRKDIHQENDGVISQVDAQLNSVTSIFDEQVRRLKEIAEACQAWRNKIRQDVAQLKAQDETIARQQMQAEVVRQNIERLTYVPESALEEEALVSKDEA